MEEAGWEAWDPPDLGIQPELPPLQHVPHRAPAEKNVLFLMAGAPRGASRAQPCQRPRHPAFITCNSHSSFLQDQSVTLVSTFLLTIWFH